MLILSTTNTAKPFNPLADETKKPSLETQKPKSISPLEIVLVVIATFSIYLFLSVTFLAHNRDWPTLIIGELIDISQFH